MKFKVVDPAHPTTPTPHVSRKATGPSSRPVKNRPAASQRNPQLEGSEKFPYQTARRCSKPRCTFAAGDGQFCFNHTPDADHNGNYVIVPRFIAFNCSDRAIAAWCALWSLSYPNGHGFRTVETSIERLAGLPGVSRSTLRRGLKELIDTGWVQQQRRHAKSGREQRSIYTLIYTPPHTDKDIDDKIAQS